MRILITGANRGLGRALSQESSKRGSQVLTLGRKESTFNFDLADLTELKKISLHPEFNAGFDTVILNAGLLSSIQPLKDTQLDEIQTIMTVNVWANKLLIDLLLKTQNPPRLVIAMSSGAAEFSNKGWGCYALSKATLNKLISFYGVEESSTHFIALSPGLVLTDMLQSLLDNPDSSLYPSLNYLHETAKQTPAQAAVKILNGIDALMALPNGSHLHLASI